MSFFHLSKLRVKLPREPDVGKDLIMTSTEILNLDDDVQVNVKFNIALKDTPMKRVPSWLKNCFGLNSQLPHHIFFEGTGLSRAGDELDDSDNVICHEPCHSSPAGCRT